MRILIIADYLPYPLIGGDRIRIYNLLRRVASRHEVSLAAFLEKPEDAEGVPHLKQICARVEAASFQRRSRLAKLSGMLRFALAGKPMELNLLHSEELVAKIKQLVSTEDFDIVQIEHSRMGLYLETLPQDRRCKSILMFHNFTFQQYSRVSHIERRWDRKMRSLLNSLAMLRWEPRYAGRFDRCTTVSTIDRDLLLKSNPRLKVDVIPNGVDVQRYQLLPAENAAPSLLFIGNMEYPPCVDAVLYFCTEIFPRILRTIPTMELCIVGRDPRSEVLQLNGGNIHVTGRVEDVLPYYRQSAVCVVPLRAGGGTRLKILEAMALGRPVVSTTIGCEGLNVIDGEHLLIADEPDQFADKTIRLLLDHWLYQRITINGRKLVEDQYDWDKVAGKLMQVYTEMVEPKDFQSMRVNGKHPILEG
jgi:sugar transferase (PEP-CTERM/EpsH1 system associated)